MSPLDRIAQLNARVAELETANALLRSQLADGQEQAKRDSATIARLAHDIKGLSKIAADFQRNSIRMAQVEAGENAVIARLRACGLA